MPKRVGYLYCTMLNKDLIRAAIIAGAKNKRKRSDVQRVMENIDYYVDKLYDILQSDSFIPTKPKSREINDGRSGKIRVIYVVPFFPDGVMHQLMVMVMQPVLMRGMYHWSCASIPKRGGSHAAKKAKKIIKQDPKGTKYILKIDVKQFYPSISHKKLIWALARKIKDKKFLKLVYDVISTCSKGLAIGYYICQWLANYFLETLDHYIVGLPGVKHMIRYMDDVVMFGPNKKQLHKARKLIEAFLNERLGLRMKENWQVFPLVGRRKPKANTETRQKPAKTRTLDFVGFKFGRHHTVLRRRNFLRFTRQCRRAQKKLNAGVRLSFKFCSGLLSRAGQLKHFDSQEVRVKYLDPIGVKNLKEVVRYESKRQLQAKCA